MICKTAEERYRILCFWERHGLLATQEAYGVSRRSLYAWRAQLRQRGGAPHVLAPGSTRPKRLRRRQWPARIVEEIRRLRKAHPNLGKEKLHSLLQRFCPAHALRCPSARTIGRLIADAPDKMRHAPVRVRPRHRHTRLRHRVSVNPRVIVRGIQEIAWPGIASSATAMACRAI